MMNKHDVSAEPKPRGPYAMVGSGEITSSISRTGDPVNGFRYRFNLYALRQSDGQVENYYGPKDLISIVKTAHVLGLFLLDEGWLSSDERERIRTLVSQLDEVFDRYAPIGPVVREAIARVIEHFWDDEKKDFAATRQEGHIFESLQVLAGYLAVRDEEEGAVVPH